MPSSTTPVRPDLDTLMHMGVPMSEELLRAVTPPAPAAPHATPAA